MESVEFGGTPYEVFDAALSLTAGWPPTILWRVTSGSSSVVECFLAKEDVAGSTPVSRSKSAFSALHFYGSWTGRSPELI